VRLDHFRGLEAAWHIPAGSATAATGSWQPGPGADFLGHLQTAFGRLPVIAEDLGFITPPVRSLRDQFDLPGMAVLQFAFDSDAKNPYLPHNHVPNMVVYTGTHDNDTTRGWYEGRTTEEREYLHRYSPPSDPEIEWRFIRMALASVCRFAVFPLQDVLGLGSEARMNTPGTTGKNWTWRFSADSLDTAIARRLRGLTVLYGRTRPAL
jgi:4-alpha-glucanotransferase